MNYIILNEIDCTIVINLQIPEFIFSEKITLHIQSDDANFDIAKTCDTE